MFTIQLVGGAEEKDKSGSGDIELLLGPPNELLVKLFIMERVVLLVLLKK